MMKKRFNNGLLWLILIFFICCQTQEKESKIFDKKISSDSLRKVNKIRRDSILLESQRAIKDGKKVNLLNFFGKILATDTTNIDDYINYASMLCLDGKADLGLKYLNKASIIDKNNSSIYFAKGLAWSFIESKKRSRDSMYFYITKAINSDSLNSYYLTARSMFYNEDSMYNKAVNDINKAINLEPNNKELITYRGIYNVSANNFEEGLNDLKNIPYSHEKDFTVYAARAFAYIRLKKIKEAIKESDISLTLNPFQARVYTLRGIAKSKLKDFDGAYEDFKKGAKLGDKESLEYVKQYNEAYQKNKQS